MPVHELPRTLNQPAPVDEAPPARPPAFDLRWMVPVFGTIVATFAAVQFFTPAPVHPDMAPTLLDQVFSTALMGCLFFTAYGFVQRNPRLGYLGAAGFASALLFGIATCPVSGHHTYGMWWGAQMALGLAAVATSTVAAIAHTRPRR
jgi:hypothetical protein